ncbi:hypothetical protein DPMN_165115 [Dreissena polymorpha]|uniref:Uncharacterized protein n=1 Tax=Dreissena polymorpha TaxID=45954 RepID=A0A9D4ISY3_DREPO|nr:hypothetical protein DPMN_165115 [Dreissena polymorpha]
MSMNHRCQENEKYPNGFSWEIPINFFPDSVADHYRHTYFEAFDLVIHCALDRFDQPGLNVLRNVEDLIVKAASYGYEH